MNLVELNPMNPDYVGPNYIFEYKIFVNLKIW